MNVNERFNIRGRVFKRITGFTAPGQDAPAAAMEGDGPERKQAWEDFLIAYGAVLSATIDECARANYQTLCDEMGWDRAHEQIYPAPAPPSRTPVARIATSRADDWKQPVADGHECTFYAAHFLGKNGSETMTCYWSRKAAEDCSLRSDSLMAISGPHTIYFQDREGLPQTQQATAEGEL